MDRVSSALLVTEVGRVTRAPVQIPLPGPGEVLVETAFSTISPGTEFRCLDGKQDGQGPFPFIPGYSASGTVLLAGPDTSTAPGSKVYLGGTRRASARTCWGGHTALAVLPAEKAFLLPEGVDLLEASLVHLAAIAFHGVRLHRPLPDQKVAVIGLGPIGQLSARLHAACGVRVVGFDPIPGRVATLDAVGLEARLVEGSLVDCVHQAFPRGADVVVDCTGAPSVLAQSAACCRDKPWDDSPACGPRLVLQGSYAGTVSLPYDPIFTRETTILCPRDCQGPDILAVIDFLARRKLPLRDLIGTVASPDQAQAVYDQLRAPGCPWITASFDWRS